MAIVLRLDRMMADRKVSLGELAEKVGIADGNLSKLKNGKVSGLRSRATTPSICSTKSSISLESVLTATSVIQLLSAAHEIA